jgi:hypothetical protein
MDNIEVGMKVLITNRKTFDELMHHPEDLRDLTDDPTYYPDDECAKPCYKKKPS